MKSYLARLVARVMPPAENLLVPPESISDPFTDAADAEADPSTAAPAAPNVPAQIPRENSPLRPPSSAHALPESALTEMSEVRPPSPKLKDRTPLPITPISLSKRFAENARQNPEAPVIRPEPTLVPRPPEPSSTPHSRPDPDGKSRDNADKAKAKESAPLKPRDDDLLRVADRFMENLQAHPPEAPAAATLKPAEDPLPLLPREPPRDKTQSSRMQFVDPAAPLLHIGNLRVDIIESSAASVGPVRSSAPKFIVRNGARASRTGPILRQRFGLRQL